jgi:O-methyltransferase
MTLNGLIKYNIRMLIRKLGYDISPIINKNELSDLSKNELELINSVKKYTLTSPERMYALIEAVRYIVKNQIPGDIVECGVWKGGSMMLVAQTLIELNNKDYELYLFDTFEGTTKPTEIDKDHLGNSMLKVWEKEFECKEKLPKSADYVPLEQVKENLFSSGYSKEKIHFIKGKVENTIPKNSPEKISILRLDTDWYESTKHELENLFPKLSSGGILIIDDYGHFRGSKKAVDEYFEKNKIKHFLNRIDYTGRLIVKT